MRAYLLSLREPLSPLTRVQKIVFAVLALGIAATRFAAISLTLHDWDETLFASAVREYDVQAHHPHPPGYPLFVVAAKLARVFTDSDFHALQAVATIASMLIFPTAFLLARELRFRTSHAFAAAAMTAFMPNVWYYGGTGFSDVPALALILVATAFLLRGGRSARVYLIGVLLTALACGIRPHLLMIAAAPAVLGALALRRYRTVAGSWAAAGLIVALTYLGAAWFTPEFPDGYLKQLRHINNHIANVDSYRNPHRPALGELAPRVFLFPSGGGRMKLAIVIVAAIGLLHAAWRRRVAMGVVLLMFLPMAIFTWLMLDMTALSRYAISYIPLQAFLAMAGIEALTLPLRRARVPLFALLSAYLVFALVKWTLPALRFARTEPSPVVAAFEWIRTNVPREGPRVFVQGGLIYHAQYFIPDYPFELVFNERVLQDEDYAVGNIFVFEGEAPPHAQPRWFRRKRLQLWEITRPRFFEIGVLPMYRIIRWGEGWHLWETDGTHRWRWMADQSVTTFGPAVSGAGTLRLRLHAPVDVTPRRPVLTIVWNGAVVDRIPAPDDGNYDLRLTLPGRGSGSNELRLITDQVITAPGDGRRLGLSMQEMSWGEPAALPLQ